NRASSAMITLHATDGVTETRTQFAVTVGAVNVPPTISAVANVTIDEDTSTPALAFTVDDPDTAVNALTVTATSSNLAVVPLDRITIDGTGSARTLKLTPLPDANGMSTITLMVSDGTLTTSTSFTLTVREVNDPPKVAPIGPLTVVENSSITVPLIITD